MTLLLKSDSLLVLRDGHPFGDIGTIEGYSKQWPLPQTLTGMIRTRIGFAKDPDFFDKEENCRSIFNYGVKRHIPLLETGSFLAPTPCDMVFSRDERTGELRVNIPALVKKDAAFGTDIENPHWLLPLLDLKDKPADETPFFLRWSVFMRYLRDELNLETGSLYEFGTSPPISETRLHNSIAPASSTSKSGQLFSNRGIYLRVYTSDGKSEAVHILIDVEDCSEGIDISGDAYLGGERKIVSLEKTDLEFPKCPDFYENRRFLKLILATHGDFGAWCPEWLMPDLHSEILEWVEVPGTNHKVRLRSACIAGYDSVSGWDYAAKSPKPTRKMVLPGAVYVIELENPLDSQKIANLFWGNPMDAANKESALSGYGQTFVGNIAIK